MSPPVKPLNPGPELLALSNKSPKQQRLHRAKAILQSQPNLTTNETVNLIAQELGLDRATVYAYIREIKKALSNGKPDVSDSESDLCVVLSLFFQRAPRGKDETRSIPNEP